MHSFHCGLTLVYFGGGTNHMPTTLDTFAMGLNIIKSCKKKTRKDGNERKCRKLRKT